jgi:hypothetical protein
MDLPQKPAEFDALPVAPTAPCANTTTGIAQVRLIFA